MNVEYKGSIEKEITKVSLKDNVTVKDHIAIEEPLQIDLGLSVGGNYELKNISITMRTPTDDKCLSVGFLFTEGIIKDLNSITNFRLGENKVTVYLKEGVGLDLSKLDRHFYTSSSCGVCGKSSIEAIYTVCDFQNEVSKFKVDDSVILGLVPALRNEQKVFQQTGGLHAAALFDATGKLLIIKEDVGRHNALDKLIGQAFLNEILPLSSHILLLSGRASFELIQKASMAGIKFIAAVGAPSSLAISCAKKFGICLIGFLKEDNYNIYTHPENIIT